MTLITNRKKENQGKKENKGNKENKGKRKINMGLK